MKTNTQVERGWNRMLNFIVQKMYFASAIILVVWDIIPVAAPSHDFAKTPSTTENMKLY